MSLKKLIYFLILAFAILGIAAKVYAVTYEPLPNTPWSERRGFYYYYNDQYYHNGPLLLSNMPYQVMQGYIVADSVVRTAPIGLERQLEKFSLLTDTAQYIYKHWYLMAEYDPLRLFAYMYRSYSPIANPPMTIFDAFCGRMYIDPIFPYVRSSYILHIKVNNTLHIDTTRIDTVVQSITTGNGIIIDTVEQGSDMSELIAYCKVLDILKGNSSTFPSLDSAIVYNGKLPSNPTGISNNTYSTPAQTDLVFSYVEQWDRGGGRMILDSAGNSWIKPNKEYIVFLIHFNGGGLDDIQYYFLTPYYLHGSFSMYPIENGNVIDEGNVLGFGDVVPVDMFKQGIRNKINEIKNYGL